MLPPLDLHKGASSCCLMEALSHIQLHELKTHSEMGATLKMGAPGLVVTCQTHSIGIKLLRFLSNVILSKSFIRQFETKISNLESELPCRSPS